MAEKDIKESWERYCISMTILELLYVEGRSRYFIDAFMMSYQYELDELILWAKSSSSGHIYLPWLERRFGLG